MRRTSILFNLFGAVGLVGLLGGCGSGGDSAPVGAGGSASGSASASGTVTGFGSLFVNGKKFEANDVLVEQDGESKRCSIGPNDTCGFKKGMQVTANGSFSGSQHTANSVRQKDALEGLVQSVAADGASLVVMGQLVLVDNTTIFDNNFTPTVGSFVEVNGHIQPNGVIQATFIEPKAPVEVTPEVRGYVSSHVAAGSTFRIGNLIVSYGGAITNDMPPGNWDDLFVEVKGANAAAFDLATVTLTASKVEPGNQGVGNNVDEFEVEGFVTNVVSVDINTRVAHFFIGATEVRTTSNTEFREGTVDEIVLGAKMSAEGRLENGVLVAKHVKFKASARLEGDIASVTGSGSALTITIQGLPNVTVKTDGLTRLDGIPVQDAHIRVRGRVIGNSTVIATRIELRPADDDVDLQGPVQSINGQTVVILSTQVDTSGFQNDDFEGLNDQPIGRAAFFNAMQVGTLVKVQGRLNGAVVTWREAELED